MRRRYRWLMAALAALVLLPVLIAAGLLLFLDPNELRAGAERSLRDQFGIPLTLSGDLHWSFWPLFSIDAGAGEIADASVTGASVAGASAALPVAPLIRWDRLRLGARWREMWNRQYHIDHVVIDGLQLNLGRDANGLGNWRSLMKSPQGSGSEVVVGRIEVHGGELSYRHEPAARPWQASKLEAAFVLRYEPARKRLNFDGPKIAASVRGTGLPDSGIPLLIQTARINIENTGESGKIFAEPLQLAIANAQLRVTLSEALTVEPLRAAGSLQFNSPSARELLRAFGVIAPPTRDASVLGVATMNASWRFADNQFAVENARLTLDGTTVTGVATVPVDTEGDKIMTVTLHADALNGDRYLRPSDQPGDPFELPITQLRSLRLRGTISIDTLTLKGATARDNKIHFDDP